MKISAMVNEEDILAKGLEARLSQTKVFFDKLRQKTIQVRDETKKHAVEIIRRILRSPSNEVAVEEIEKQFSPEDIASTEETQYARRYKVDGKWYLGLGSVAYRDLTRGYCPGHAIIR